MDRATLKGILRTILFLKELDNQEGKELAKDLEHEINREMVEKLVTVQELGNQLGYKTVQKLLKDVSTLMDELEQGKTDWKD